MTVFQHYMHIFGGSATYLPELVSGCGETKSSCTEIVTKGLHDVAINVRKVTMKKLNDVDSAIGCLEAKARAMYLQHHQT
jgi:hypothetical protein